jgi:hypothetical protein
VLLKSDDPEDEKCYVDHDGDSIADIKDKPEVS